MTKRKQYTKEFKLDAASLVTAQGYSRAEAARRLGVNANMLSRWLNESQSSDQAFRGNGKQSVDQQEIVKLRGEIKRLEMEKEILKKAAVFFARETK